MLTLELWCCWKFQHCFFLLSEGAAQLQPHPLPFSSRWELCGYLSRFQSLRPYQES